MEWQSIDPVERVSQVCGIRCTRLNTIPENGLYVVEAGFADGSSLKATSPNDQKSAWTTFWVAAQGRG